MTTADSATAAGDSRDIDELALIAARFPGFRIWRETTGEGTRYAAQARSLTTRPNTVITDDLAELRVALDIGRQPVSGTSTIG